jgi:hypothetical protein
MLSTSILLAASMVVGQVEELSNYEHLKEYGEAMVGEWIVEINVDFDFPPLVKKGDIAILKVSNKWILDKSAICSHTSIEVKDVTIASGHGLIGWDRSAERIVTCGFGSLGSRDEGIVEKRNGKWHRSGTGVGVTGNVNAGTSIVTILDDDTHEVLNIGRLSPHGEPLPNMKWTAKRVK